MVTEIKTQSKIYWQKKSSTFKGSSQSQWERMMLIGLNVAFTSLWHLCSHYVTDNKVYESLANKHVSAVKVVMGGGQIKHQPVNLWNRIGQRFPKTNDVIDWAAEWPHDGCFHRLEVKYQLTADSNQISEDCWDNHCTLGNACLTFALNQMYLLSISACSFCWLFSDDLGRPEEEDSDWDWVFHRGESREASAWQVRATIPDEELNFVRLLDATALLIVLKAAIFRVAKSVGERGWSMERMFDFISLGCCILFHRLLLNVQSWSFQGRKPPGMVIPRT